MSVCGKIKISRLSNVARYLWDVSVQECLRNTPFAVAELNSRMMRRGSVFTISINRGAENRALFALSQLGRIGVDVGTMARTSFGSPAYVFD